MDQNLSGVQRFIQKKLEDNWLDTDDIISKMVEIAGEATKANPVTWEPEIDYKLRSDLLLKMLEMSWLHKQKSDVNVFNLTKIVYGN